MADTELSYAREDACYETFPVVSGQDVLDFRGRRQVRSCEQVLGRNIVDSARVCKGSFGTVLDLGLTRSALSTLPSTAPARTRKGTQVREMHHNLEKHTIAGLLESRIRPRVTRVPN